MASPEQSRAWRLRNPGHVSAYDAGRRERRACNNQRRLYGITLKDRNRILRSQGYRCAGCRRPKRRWQTDHCHTTGRVRGVLCPSCNKALGLLRDKPAVLRRLANYLEK